MLDSLFFHQYPGIMFISLCIALVADHLLGEPRKFHPLLGLGWLINRCESLLWNNEASAKWRGAMGVAVLVLVSGVLVYGLGHIFILFYVLPSILLYLCIGRKSLVEHVDDIEQALEEDDLNEARKNIGMIVSRDTNELTPAQIVKATIESILENGSDAIFAPIFWFVIFGPIGCVVYRVINTLDAMWGYKNTRYVQFGWAAAKLDDVVNYIPAILVAVTYALLGKTKQAFNCWQTQAYLLASPNGGKVMASGAGSLGVLLGGPAMYHGQLLHKPVFGAGNEPELADINRALTLIDKTLFSWVAVIFVVLGISGLL